MRVTAKVDYATRALVELARATASPTAAARLVKAHELASAQRIPAKYCETILTELKRAGMVTSMRGGEGGYGLQQPAEQITIADVIRAVEGPLADVRGVRPNALTYPDDLAALQRMWIAVRANLRGVLERTTIADLRDGRLPDEVDALAEDPDAWAPR